MKRYVSYSEMSTFFWNEDEWYERYIEGKEMEMNEDILIGKHIHNWMEEEKYPIYKELKEMGIEGKRMHNMRKLLNKAQRKRAPIREVSARAALKDGTKLFALFDGFNDSKRVLYEYKTSPEADGKWNQWRVDINDQLSFYALVRKKTYYDYFKEIVLVAMDTTRGNCKTYKTVRGPKDLEHIENKIKKFVSDVKSKGLWEKRLSRRDRELIRQGRLKL